MQGVRHNSPIQRRLVDTLYVEAMLLADDARSYFDDDGRDDRDLLAPMARVTFSCESLKVTTRLMHVIAWLLTQRAVLAGELLAREALDPSRRLGDSPGTIGETVAELPGQAQALVMSSIDLHRRVARLDAAQEGGLPEESPARQMFQRLAMAF
jgi:regulator of CtrA degradation